MQQQQALGVHVSTCQDSVKRADRLRPNDFTSRYLTQHSVHIQHIQTPHCICTHPGHTGASRGSNLGALTWHSVHSNAWHVQQSNSLSSALHLCILWDQDSRQTDDRVILSESMSSAVLLGSNNKPLHYSRQMCSGDTANIGAPWQYGTAVHLLQPVLWGPAFTADLPAKLTTQGLQCSVLQCLLHGTVQGAKAQSRVCQEAMAAAR